MYSATGYGGCRSTKPSARFAGRAMRWPFPRPRRGHLHRRGIAILCSGRAQGPGPGVEPRVIRWREAMPRGRAKGSISGVQRIVCSHTEIPEGFHLRSRLRLSPTPSLPPPAMSPTSDPLDAAVHALREATPPQPESVQQEVWRRIAHAEPTPSPSVLPWWRRLEAAFAHPAFATAFVAACLLLGLFLAEVRLNHLHRERTVSLERSYLQLIDPLLNATDLPRAQPALHRP